MSAFRFTILAASFGVAVISAPVARADDTETVATSTTAKPAGPDTTKPAPATEPAPPQPPGVAPTEASGVEVDEEPSTAEKLKWIPRTLLFLPRWGFWVVAQPLRGAAWTYDVTRDKLKGALFSADEVYGIYPVASYSTDYGFSVGARFVHYNVFGEKEKLKLFADWGGQFRQGYGVKLSSGERIAKRFTANLEARFQRRPGERFFGIGNAAVLDAPPELPIDPMTSDAAISARFREDLYRVSSYVDTRIAGDLFFRVTGAWADRTFASSDANGESIAARYDTSRLVGFDTGIDNIYAEAELIYDSRRSTNPYISQVMDATGWYLSAFTGRAKGLYSDTTDYLRYGGEVQRFFDLYRGSRVLTLRALIDGVTGTDGRTDGKISFVELPRLGGPDLLRGYPSNRFRDRAVAMVTAEYSWDLGNYFGGYTFCDAGRALPDPGELGSIRADSIRLGCGAGIEMRTYRSFLLRGQVAASRDGDVFFELALAPAFGRRDRAGRF